MTLIIDEVTAEMQSTSATLQAIGKLLPELARDISNTINTPYASYADTNYSVDTDDERSKIRSMIPPISLIMEDMKAISATFDRLYGVLNRARKVYLRLVSPMAWIPPELLSDIFIRSATAVVAPLYPPDEGRMPYFHNPNKVKVSPSGYLNVAQVCRRWRDVALNTPRLWTRIEIAPVVKSPWKDKILSTSFPLPLGPIRGAAGLPTFITLDLRAIHIVHDPNVDYLPVNPACSSVRAIDVVQPLLSSPLVGLSQWLYQFGNLTHIVLDDVGIDVQSDTEFSGDRPLAGVPSDFFDRLTHIHIRSEYVYQIDSFFEIRTWSNLRSLTIDMYDECDVGPRAMEMIFSHMPNLVELWIAEDEVEIDGTWGSTHITSDKLRLFSLVVDPHYLPNGYEMGLLFGSLTLPALTDLVVTSPLEGNVAFLWDFLIRSQCHLSSLTFTDVSDHDLANVDSSLIHKAGISLGEEFHVPSVNFTRNLKETRLFREAKDRWYSV